MKDYQNALDWFVGLMSTQLGFDDVKNEKQSLLLQELVDKEIELQSRKDKLVVGSAWECVVPVCYLEHEYDFKTIRITKGDVVIIKEVFEKEICIQKYGLNCDNIEHFLLCFAPKGEK